MKVEIELSGIDIQYNINAIQRIIDGKQKDIDFISLFCTLSILKAIKKQVKNKTNSIKKGDKNG